jgi:hypothetical protein
MAAGMGKPVLILASDRGAFPAAVGGLTYLATDLGNREAIEYGLEQLLAGPGSRPMAPAPDEPESHPIGNSADRLLETLTASRASGTIRAGQLVEIVYEAIKESGASTLARESSGEGGKIADLAVWSNDLEPWIGNPLIIEVKQALTGRKDLQQAILQVSQMLDETRSPHGLLLYLTARPAVLYGGAYDSRVIVMSIEEFIGGLRDMGLGQLLRRARNELAHARS